MRERRGLTTRRVIAAMGLLIILTTGCTRASDVHLSESDPDAQTPTTEVAGV